jgi:hypothetical protein
MSIYCFHRKTYMLRFTSYYKEQKGGKTMNFLDREDMILPEEADFLEEEVEIPAPPAATMAWPEHPPTALEFPKSPPGEPGGWLESDPLPRRQISWSSPGPQTNGKPSTMY